MKFLSVLGWIFVPYIMLPLRWKRLSRGQKMAAIIWIIIVLFGGCVNGIASTEEPGVLPREKPAAEAPEDEKEPERLVAQVVTVVDGDTMKVKIEGQPEVETVRLLLVDTPETQNANQPFGAEAASFAKAELEGKEVQLEKDVSDRDRYGRLLRYVYIGDRMFNELLLEKGLARVAVYPPDVKYVDAFRAVQDEARRTELGIWSIENYATDEGFNEEAAAPEQPAEPKPAPAPQKPAEPAPKPAPAPAPAPKPAPKPAPAKEPAQADSDVFFKNCTEVRNAGKAPLRKGDPGYSNKLDRDGDGVACEK